jgi:hypothetical protein
MISSTSLTKFNRSLTSNLHNRRAVSLHAYVEHPSLLFQLENILKDPSKLSALTEYLPFKHGDGQMVSPRGLPAAMPNLTQSLETLENAASSFQSQLSSTALSLAAQASQLAQEASPKDFHPFQVDTCL